MLVIGLTGSLASGKSTVAAIFRRKGAVVINADRIVHRLLAPQGACYKAVVRTFGRQILKGERIERKKLAAIVFEKKSALKRLERIVHPVVRKEIRAKLKKYSVTNKRVILEVPLLFEAGLDKWADVTVVVKATRTNQLLRATLQHGMSKAEAIRRILSQMPLREKVRKADFIIDNNGTKKQTEKQVNALWQKL